MVFSTHLFLFYFLPLAIGVYLLSPTRWRIGVLTVVSYVFYGWAHPIFVPLLLGSTLLDYFCGLGIAQRLDHRRSLPIERLTPDGPRTRGQRLALTISIVGNLAVLGVFRYFNFGVSAYNDAAAALGLTGAVWESAIHIAAPLGVAYYTLQSLSYTIDVYRGRVRAERGVWRFACYVAAFPQLLAGPIVRYGQLREQLGGAGPTMAGVARGVALFSIGLGKKVLLADRCGEVADVCFDAAGVGVVEAWAGAAAFTFQIYFDFSGYMDMALGVGLMLGFVLPRNFNAPYRAVSISEFWRRWHITLSTWLRDYIYVPLGGDRRGGVRTTINIALVCLIGGLWHGAGWTFLAWGAVHGVYLIFERWCGGPAYRRLPRYAGVGLTFLLVMLAWVVFRADSLSHAGTYYASMVGAATLPESAALVGGLIFRPAGMLALAGGAVVAWALPSAWRFTERLTPLRGAICLALLWSSIAVGWALGSRTFVCFFQ